MQQISTRYTHSLELLEQVVKRHSSPTTLIICWERKQFFDAILSQLLRSQTRSPPHEIASSQQSETTDQNPSLFPDHAFLTPTLQILSTSKSIKLIYCPTVSLLRAYLASHAPHGSSKIFTSPPSRVIILDLLALHHGTSEFTFQGLSQTFASAVSAAYQTQSDLTLVECKDINDPTDPYRGSWLCNAEIPLLSGSVKIGQEGARWAGRSMTVRKLASRWFTFEEKPDQSHGAPAGTVVKQDDDEMLLW